jgi:hypothetical protein
MRPRARDRGRIYFGPIAGAVVSTDASLRTVIVSGAATDILRWLKSINQLTTGGGTTWTLGVWSRKNAVIKQLQQASIDDRVDYQRRRSDQSGVKYIQALP